MNAIETHKLSQADHKPICFDVFKPHVHRIVRSVRMLVLNCNKHLRFNLKINEGKQSLFSIQYDYGSLAHFLKNMLYYYILDVEGQFKRPVKKQQQQQQTE